MTRDQIEELIRRVSMDVIVKAGFEWYGTPQASIAPNTRGLNDFKLGVEAFAKAFSESLPKGDCSEPGGQHDSKAD